MHGVYFPPSAVLNQKPGVMDSDALQHLGPWQFMPRADVLLAFLSFHSFTSFAKRGKVIFSLRGAHSILFLPANPSHEWISQATHDIKEVSVGLSNRKS